MLELIGLCKEYNGKRIVQDLNLHLKAGEIYGLLGPNGAGKSTTIRMAVGLRKPTKGCVRLFGRTLDRSNKSSLKRRIGVLCESPHLYGEMTAWEYLAFFADLYGVERKCQRLVSLFDRLDLGVYRNQRINTFSKGMQQKLGLARVFIHDPELIILDEPTTSLDPCGIKQVRDLILEENQRGKSFLISSHLLSEIEKTCMRVGIMNHGRLLLEDTTDGIVAGLCQGMELELETENLPQTAIDALRRLTCVETLNYEGRHVYLRTKGRLDHRAEIARVLMEQGCLVLSMRQKRMGLEDAFVAITESDLSLLTREMVKS